MKKLLLLLILSCFSFAGFSQKIPVEKSVVEAPASSSTKDTLIDVPNTSVYADAAQIKTISGKTVTRFLAENYSFPVEALEEEISGTIYVQFVVEKDGTVSNVTIEKGLCKVCDEEAVRVVKRLRVHPVLIEGSPSRIRYRVPIRLVLE